ncbi:unnamed protein product [Meloidogyne enterolobii]|uniref:Uncharacterized protein n=1 Tax=Meloidogyne enterolobii TaxID=390850 RepID=A0ACB1AWU4_MELEN
MVMFSHDDVMPGCKMIDLVRRLPPLVSSFSSTSICGLQLGQVKTSKTFELVGRAKYR